MEMIAKLLSLGQLLLVNAGAIQIESLKQM